MSRWQFCAFLLLIPWLGAGLVTTTYAAANATTFVTNEVGKKTYSNTEDQIDDIVRHSVQQNDVNRLSDTNVDDHYKLDDVSLLSVNELDRIHTTPARAQNDDDATNLIWLIRKDDNSTHSYRNHTEKSLSWERKLQSCVTSLAALKAAVAKGATRVSVCTSKIPLGSLNRRRRLLSDEGRGLQGVLTGLGGGIDVSHRTIVFTCLLKKRCILDGEGISRIFYGTNTTVMIEGFQFYNASTVDYDSLGSGSALSFLGNSQVTLKDCSFHYNNARYGGGAIMMNNSKLTFKKSHRLTRFYKNSAQYGGAIYGINNSTIQTNITSSSSSTNRYLRKNKIASPSSSSSDVITFQVNSAITAGGAVYVTGGAVQCNQITMEDNDATAGGAAVLIGVSGIMTNMTMSRNTANVTGGAFLMVNSSVSIVDSTFQSNDAAQNRGGVSAFTSNVSVTGSTTFLKSCWSDGSICVNGTTCDLCCDNPTYWIVKQFTACGKEQSWSDGRICGEETTCLLCTNGSQYWYSKAFTACGQEPCWLDGRNCLQGYGTDATCNACCNASTYWFSKAFTACGREQCWGDGRTCIQGNGTDANCNACCNPSTFWVNKASTACGRDSNCWVDGRICSNETCGNCDACCNPYTYWDRKVNNACGIQPKKCFTNKAELSNAVASYTDPNTIDTYGIISDWCVGRVTDFSFIFSSCCSCNSFNEDISKWDTSNATTMANMFNLACSFNQDISKWNVSKVTDMSLMFQQATSFNQDISDWSVGLVTDMKSMFNNDNSFNQDISKWDVSQVTDMNYMFFYATSFNQDISTWDVSKVTNMNSMFESATSFNGNISKWNVSQVTVMIYMFYGAISFNQHISTWDVSKVSNMYAMFSNATSFNSNINKWNVSQVTDMSNMFADASSFNQDISTWDVSKVTNMDTMFYNAASFNQNLCAWKNKCQSFYSFSTFSGTNCPNQNDTVCGIGPFCYKC